MSHGNFVPDRFPGSPSHIQLNVLAKIQSSLRLPVIVRIIYFYFSFSLSLLLALSSSCLSSLRYSPSPRLSLSFFSDIRVISLRLVPTHIPSSFLLQLVLVELPSRSIRRPFLFFFLYPKPAGKQRLRTERLNRREKRTWGKSKRKRVTRG